MIMNFICVRVFRVDAQGRPGGNRYSAKAYAESGHNTRVWADEWICESVASVPETRSKIEKRYRGMVREVWIDWPEEDNIASDVLVLASPRKKLDPPLCI